jgi:hypothetical protein
MPVFSVRKLAINPPARHIIIQILKRSSAIFSLILREMVLIFCRQLLAHKESLPIKQKMI